METPTFVVFEHAAGYALFRVKEFEEIGQILPQVEASVADLAKFASVVKLHAFTPFANTEAALDNCNAVTEGILHNDLLTFLDGNLPREKNAKTLLGVGEAKLAAAINEQLKHVGCSYTGVVPEIIRGIRTHFGPLVKGLPHSSLGKAQLGLGHSYSRGKVKFNVNRVDNMIIQAIALLDQLDKDINTFGMRIREWYSYHFPELYKIVPDQYQYCRCARAIKDKKIITEETTAILNEILNDEEKVAEVLEASRSSMGMDISPMDLINVERFANRICSLVDYKQNLQNYLKDRMQACAPNLATLIGDQVGARLISHAGSLTNLAKYPASTVQILGAEKALFRALKTRGNTPKYGLLFHSTFIGRAGAKNKGRISRYLANKCSIASRIDCFTEVPISTFGEHLKQQVEDRLKYLDSGELPKKNLEVMKEAATDAVVATEKAVKKVKRRNKKEKKAKDEAIALALAAAEEASNKLTEDDEPPKKKKKKAQEEEVAPVEEPVQEKKKKKKAQKEEETVIFEEPIIFPDEVEKKKKKKKRKLSEPVGGDQEMEETEEKQPEPMEEEPAAEESKKKKKKKKQRKSE